MSRIVDLSVALENAMPAHKNFPSPIILPFADHAGTRALGFGTPDDPFTSSILYLSMLEHVGTHIDAFFHMNPDGATVDEMPIEMFMGKAITLDLRHIPDLGDIDVPDMEAAEEKAGVTIDGHIVLLCTGFSPPPLPQAIVDALQPGHHRRRHPLAGRPRGAPARRRRAVHRQAHRFHLSQPQGSAGIGGSRTMSGCATWKSSSAPVSSSSRAFP